MADNDEKLAQFQVLFLVDQKPCNKCLSHTFTLWQIESFQSITGCDAERAQFYLESAGYALDLAMASFYEGEGEVRDYRRKLSAENILSWIL